MSPKQKPSPSWYESYYVVVGKTKSGDLLNAVIKQSWIHKLAKGKKVAQINDYALSYFNPEIASQKGDSKMRDKDDTAFDATKSGFYRFQIKSKHGMYKAGSVEEIFGS